ncbi:MAG: hypothetical protein AAB465_01250 [Patescibacteria group bacterium]
MKKKTKKIIAKRFVVKGKKKNKKLMHLTCGSAHFNAREKGKTTKNKRRKRMLANNIKRVIIKYI